VILFLTRLPPARLVASKAFIPEWFAERGEGQAGLQNGLRVRKSDFDWRKRSGLGQEEIDWFHFRLPALSVREAQAIRSYQSFVRKQWKKESSFEISLLKA